MYQDCWNPDPTKRPAFEEISQRLRSILLWEKAKGKPLKPLTRGITAAAGRGDAFAGVVRAVAYEQQQQQQQHPQAARYNKNQQQQQQQQLGGLGRREVSTNLLGRRQQQQQQQQQKEEQHEGLEGGVVSSGGSSQGGAGEAMPGAGAGEGLGLTPGEGFRGRLGRVYRVLAFDGLEIRSISKSVVAIGLP
jgi:hypothetical protein